MLFARLFIRGVLLGIPLWLTWQFASEGGRNFAPLYFASKPEYRQFLEDLDKGGRAKAEAERLFSRIRKDHEWYLKDTLALSRLIALRANPLHWSEDKIRDLSQYVLVMSYRYRVSPAFVLSVIQVESNFQTDAVSPKGAIGLMQLLPSTGKEIAERVGMEWQGVHTLRDPKRNIELGLEYVVELRKRFKKPELVLLAYNMGPYALEKRLRAGEKLPMGYYEKVMQAMNEYRKQANPPVAASASWSDLWL